MNELNPSLCSIEHDFVLKLSVSQMPNITYPLKRLLISIAVFTLLKSYTFAFSQYTAFLKLYILYYSLKIAGLPDKLIHFPYAV